MTTVATRLAITAGVLPARSGLGLKPEHFRTILETSPDLGFFEIHAENYMVDGGPFHRFLSRIRSRYPLSIHGVGLSIGGESSLDEAHLDRLAALLERYAPQSFSEHLAWSSHGEVFLNDLLPVPYHAATLARALCQDTAGSPEASCATSGSSVGCTLACSDEPQSPGC